MGFILIALYTIIIKEPTYAFWDGPNVGYMERDYSLTVIYYVLWFILWTISIFILFIFRKIKNGASKK